jgi:hypothetical protein
MADSSIMVRAACETQQDGAERRIALCVRQGLEFRGCRRRDTLAGAGRRSRRAGRWRPHHDAEFRGPRGPRRASRRFEQLPATEAELRCKCLMLHEQSEFGVGMTNDVTAACQRGREQSADALLHCLETASAGQHLGQAAARAAPGAFGGEQILRADDPSRATIQ